MELNIKNKHNQTFKQENNIQLGTEVKLVPMLNEKNTGILTEDLLILYNNKIYLKDYYERNGSHDYYKGLQLVHNSSEPLPSNQLLISAFIKKNNPYYPGITGIIAYLNDSGVVSNITPTSIDTSSADEITVIPL